MPKIKTSYFLLLFTSFLFGCEQAIDFSINWDRFDTSKNIEIVKKESKNEYAQTVEPPNTSPAFTIKFSELRQEIEGNFKDDIKVMSWNIQTLGRTKSDDEIKKIAQTMRYFDLVAVQEVVAKDPAGAQAVAKIADELNRMGAQWDYQVSDPTRSSSPYKSERYAFLWKTSKVKQVSRAKLDKQLETYIEREPFVGSFKIVKNDSVLTLANFHAKVYKDQPQDEIELLVDYPERWESNYFILCGDFNTSETDGVWEQFYHRNFINALYRNPTTIKRKCKGDSYESHQIDNLYYRNNLDVKAAGKIDFIEDCDNLDERHLSDHFPVFLIF